MKTYYLLLICLSALLISCTQNYYKIEDFQAVEKIDAHVHIYTEKGAGIEQAQNDNFKLFTINTNAGKCEKIDRLHSICKNVKQQFPQTIEFATTFCLDGFEEPGWAENTIAWIDSCRNDGAIAVKVWKNIGMVFRDTDNNLVMIDDSRFDPVFKYLAEVGIPLIGHLGEPKNCWLPLEDMTTNNDRSYFSSHPEYHMYLHPEMPSYEEQMAARDRMLEKNPILIFIGCHLASLEWDVEEIANFLDRFPNSAVDMAARMGQLFFQTKDNREKVRDFFIKYQDRILYGTDIIDNGDSNTEGFQNRIHITWLNDWEYLVTDNLKTSDLIEGEFQGLKLPKKVVDKIYFENTKKWYKGFD
ncbi:MAG: amidohydrolase family protein [Mariniphaga sp.]|nr:amidohydrolase family protein [Mariniphaga sp.]